MLTNYFKIAFRNLIKYKGFSIINILGLSIGLASAMLILFYVLEELSYEDYHQQAGQIYRVSLNGRVAGQDMNMALSCVPLGEALTEDYPEVLKSVKLSFVDGVMIRYRDRSFVEDRVMYADSMYAQVFTVDFIEGDPEHFLNRPNTIALTQSTAKKYFGNQNPIGKMIEFGEEQTLFEVTHLIADAPLNSHFHYDFIVPFLNSRLSSPAFDMWITNNNYTYILLPEDYDPGLLKAKFPAMIKKYVGPEFESLLGTSLDEFEKSDNQWGYQLTPIKDIHLHSNLDYEIEANGSITMVYIFSVIAVFLIVIAGINFMNLSTARSANRAKEVGIRKVVGSSRKQLIAQFFTESVLITFISLIIAILLVELTLPYFNQFTNKSLTIDYFANPEILLGLFVIGVAVGVFAGSYPAFYLSAFRPIKVLKGSLNAGARNSLFRNILVVFQFVITIVLIIATLVVYNQLNFIRQKDLGFEKEGLLVIKRSLSLGNNAHVFKENILKNPDIIKASYATTIPGQDYGNTVFVPEGLSVDEGRALWFCAADYDFAQTLNLELEQGRYFSRDYASDSSAVVVNSAVLNTMGYDESSLDKKITLIQGTNQNIDLNIIGITNFNFESLHHQLRPLVILLDDRVAGNLLVRMRSENVVESIEFLKNEWDKLVPNQPFVYSFLSNDLETKYRNEKKTGLIVMLFSVLAIIIALLGLLGLASFMAEQRTKEIGIRKVMGASVTRIMSMLSKEIVILIIISTLIAWPLAYYLMSRWLQDFAFAINLKISVFIFASVISFLLAMITVGYRAYSAATINPAQSLRDE
ncbi:MAG: FtsX-like permease family protein [Bacteroidales bacterium]|jgi:putative ABC transport system permease protein|nr:FtsX-like permease family protein [Bacteroidales bacterium]